MRSVEPSCPISLHPSLPSSEASVGGLPVSRVRCRTKGVQASVHPQGRCRTELPQDASLSEARALLAPVVYRGSQSAARSQPGLQKAISRQEGHRCEVTPTPMYVHELFPYRAHTPHSSDQLWLLDSLMHWPWRRQWHPTPVLLPGKSHGQRSLVGCSPWGC